MLTTLENVTLKKETKQRSLEIFEQSIKSPVTKKNYKRGLDKFLQFTKSPDYDSLARTNPRELEKLVMDYVIHLKEKYGRGELRSNSFNSYIAPIELFCVVNDIILNFKKIKHLFPPSQKLTGELPFTDEDIQKMLESTNSKKWKMIIHVMASTGMRPAALLGLRLRDIQELDDGCATIKVYADEPEEYGAFLTPEANISLKECLEERRSNGEILTPDSFLCRNHYRKGDSSKNIKKMSSSTLYDRMSRIQENAGIRSRTNSSRSRHEKRVFYGFRKRYNTKLKNNIAINPNIAEKIMGHKLGLDGVYFVPTREQCFSEFKKAIPDLTVNEAERQRIQIKKLESYQSDQVKKTPELVNQATERIKQKIRLEGCIVDFDRTDFVLSQC